MTPVLCATVDVEDFSEGMAVLGVSVPGPPRQGDGLASMVADLGDRPNAPKVTLFVVGNYAGRMHKGLAACLEAGHEIASHGPDHGRLPETGLVDWLRRGRDMLEQLLQTTVLGFRSPRFDIPAAGLAAYRDALAEAGYRYVSDTSALGPASPVRELPVLRLGPLPVGGGSYQRVLPRLALSAALDRVQGPAVLYYHSYDFDGSLPERGALRSPALARQLLGRKRVADRFRSVTTRYGSRTCADVVS